MTFTDILSKVGIRRASKKEISQQIAWSSMGPRDFLYSRNKPLLLSTVYRCVNLLSDSLAVLPLKTYYLDKNGFKTEALDSPLFTVLNLEPNENMTRFTFFKTMMISVLLRGNAYAYIERDGKGQVSQLVYLPADNVTIEFVRDGNGILRKRYRVSGFKRLVEPQDIIHVLNFSDNGVIGVSTLSHAAQTLGIATSAEEHSAAFFENGGSTTGVLKVEGGRLSKSQKDDIYKTWAERTSGPNGIAIIEGNMSYQPISISPKDSQLIEARAFQVIEICRMFNVNPVKAFDLSKSSYSTVEATQLQYLTDTVLPIITNFEQEFTRKLILPYERNSMVIEFDTSVILRTNKEAEAAYLRDMTYIGAITPNEIRKHTNLPPLENGNTPFVQVNMQPLDFAVQPKLEEPKTTKKSKSNKNE